MAEDLKKAGLPGAAQPMKVQKPKPVQPPKPPQPPKGPSATPRPSIIKPVNSQPKISMTISNVGGGLAKSGDNFEQLLANTAKSHNSPNTPAMHANDEKLEHVLEARLKAKFPAQANTLQKADDDHPAEPMARQRVEHGANKKLAEYTPPAAKAPKTGPVPKSPNYKLLTPMESNAKTAKNEGVEGSGGQPHFSAILHLAPATLAGVGNVCEAATPGCRDACLNTAGRGGMFKAGENTNVIQDARIRKTRQLAENPGGFMDSLIHDIGQVRRHAASQGAKPVVRLNGTSDIAWEDLKLPHFGGKNIFEAHPDVQFYDYTKRPDRVMKNKHSNYHLTFSNSGKNENISKRLLAAGHNVAAVFGGKQLPGQWNGHKVISGDEHDLRFLDERGGQGKPGVVVGLKAKGDAKGDKTGFVVWNHEGNKEGAGPRELKQVKREQVEGNQSSRAQQLMDLGKKKVEKSMNNAGATGVGALKKDDPNPVATSVKNAFGGGSAASPTPKADAGTGSLGGDISASLTRRLGKSHNEWEVKLAKSDWPVPGIVPPSGKKSSEGQHALKKDGHSIEPGKPAPSNDPAKLEKAPFGFDKLKKGASCSAAPLAKEHIGFDKLKAKLANKPGIKDPGAVAASIGNKKYGKGSMEAHAKSGKPELAKELVVNPPSTPKEKDKTPSPQVQPPTGQAALDMIRHALERRTANNIPGGKMSPQETQHIVDSLGGSARPKPDLTKAQYAKTEPVEVREGKKAAQKKSDEQKARINQDLKTEVTDYVKNRNGAKYEGMSSDSARKSRRGVKDQPAGAVTNPPLEKSGDQPSDDLGAVPPVPMA